MIRRLIEKGPRVVAHRAWQLGQLSLLRAVRYWDGLQQEAHEYWTVARTEEWMREIQAERLLIGPIELDAFKEWAQQQVYWVDVVRSIAKDSLLGKFRVFEQDYQFDPERLPWHTDWRYSYTWDPAYYKSYNFYDSDKIIPYDVKFPWELSRLSNVVPVSQIAVLSGEDRWADFIAWMITDWERSNPVAYSVNWNPMECSMRSINLTFVAQILAATSSRPENLAPLLRQLTLHGEFLFRNVEYTDIRGNHYAANLVSLLVLGCTLQDVYPRARHWRCYAVQRISTEIELQYCSDGVNFEKSVGYHRLVTELFLIALIVARKADYQISRRAQQRIERACEYTRSYMRPDGVAPNWGDNDSARALCFDPGPINDHTSLLALGAAYFANSAFKSTTPCPSASVPWLLGKEGIRQWEEMEVRPKSSIASFFESSGMVVCRAGGNYLFADFGEVGLSGRGGHGHNDTFSFELCLFSQPVIVDPGNPTYTGDLRMHQQYRGTGFHNTVRIDREEMAPLFGPWRISDAATPRHVHFESTARADVIQGEHEGYSRLQDPVRHARKLVFDKQEGRLVCQDSFFCREAHVIEHSLHFAPHVTLELLEDRLRVRLQDGKEVTITWWPVARARLEKVCVSAGYGQLEDSRRLVLEREISSDTETEILISSNAADPDK